MTTRNKLIEDFQTKIRKIFKESVEDSNAPIAPAPETIAPPEGGALPGGEVAPEEPKVTLSVSLLKSLLSWAHGEEEGEESEEEDELAGEEGLEGAPEVPPTTPALAEEASPAVPNEPSVGEEGEEGGEEGLEDTGVESVEIDALVSKIQELGQAKEVLTDEDFGEIVAAAEAVEGDEGTDDLSGVLDDAGAEAGAEAPESEIKEEIGKVIPTGAKFKNEGNKGIGK